ncbi:hypothetical protein BDV24DRAFT_125634 [Aspergillus arachidicola]|uniref:Uncharacterized protein n=1 Tax=Aspergillus arachidicola TaxID=656916 RepID=A0A5N6YIC0_9EURO|nr:hypothetical protein BDV24DRAFT_125634 [Aspergillus arachidicola]
MFLPLDQHTPLSTTYELINTSSLTKSPEQPPRFHYSCNHPYDNPQLFSLLLVHSTVGVELPTEYAIRSPRKC